MLKKIISGGQTGADTAGLHAAQELKLETGGYAPKGFKTEKGINEELSKFNLIEAASSDYTIRTELNVAESDGTVLFGNTHSRGSKQTIFFCKKYSKPYFIVEDNSTPNDLYSWVSNNNIETLNVAGNRESKAPDIEERAKQFLVKAFNW